MKDGQAYIVVAQTHEKVLREIRQKRDSHSKNHVTFFSNPGSVLEEVLREPVDIVVTGQCFYQTDLNSFHEVLMARMEAMIEGPEALDRHYRPPLSSPNRGTVLAHEIHRINPNVLVFRYSVAPEEVGELSGEIAKDVGAHSDLLRFLDSLQLAAIVAKKDWQQLMTTFPFIQFYHPVGGWKNKKEERLI